jgi:hypothetical protein
MTSEPSHAVASTAEPQQKAATMTMVTAAPLALLVPTPVGSDRAAVVVIANDDASPPGWDQWSSSPAPAPEPQVGVIVIREGGTVIPCCHPRFR